MNKYKLSMKTPSGLGTEYIYVESKYDNFERYLKEHNLKYQKQDFKTNQDKEIEKLREENLLLKASEPMSKLQEDYGYKAEVERLNNIINELEKDLEDKYYGRGKYAMDSEVIGIIEVLNKLQQLKGSDKE